MAPTYRSTPTPSESRSTRVVIEVDTISAFGLKVLSTRADDDDVEPVDPGSRGAMTPPSRDVAAPLSTITTRLPTTPTAPNCGVEPGWSSVPPVSTASPFSTTPPSRAVAPQEPGPLRAMAPWRIAGAMALVATFSLMGWQVQRLIDDQPWSDQLMWLSVSTGIVAALCVLGWTWTTTDNARRLVEPAARANIPDPNAAVRTWIVPFVFVSVAIGVVAIVGARVGTTGDRTIEALPLAMAVGALLLAIPMTYRPMNHLAGVVRQVGGYTVRVAQWMWVPVVMALVGIASIAALRYAGVDDTAGSNDTVSNDTVWVPLWVVAVVAIAPCVITVLLAWRAASSVEDAIIVADARRRPGTSPRAKRARRPQVQRPASADRTKRIELVPGAELLRLTVVTLCAGLALLSLVGAGVSAMLWMDSRDTGPLPADRRRLWDILDGLRAASAGATAALLAAVFLWTFVTVLNVRRTSGRRRDPLIAASVWPAAAAAIWWIADRTVVDASIGGVVLGFGAQAAVLAVPFLVLERSVDAVGARRTPLRIVYALTVVLLVHVQGLGGLSRLPDAITTTEPGTVFGTDIGRLAGYLAIGALIQLCSTLAVTEACRSLSRSCQHEADHHNMLVTQRTTRGDRVESAAPR